ncbi:MAG: hypothetical protein QXO67_04170 [Candidatus Bathyarchaeia archaeon]
MDSKMVILVGVAVLVLLFYFIQLGHKPAIEVEGFSTTAVYDLAAPAVDTKAREFHAVFTCPADNQRNFSLLEPRVLTSSSPLKQIFVAYSDTQWNQNLQMPRINTSATSRSEVFVSHFDIVLNIPLYPPLR